MIKITNLHGISQEDIKQKMRQSKDAREHERWVCINSSIKELSPPEIAEILNRDEKTIREWITSFNLEGPKGIERNQPPGKKKLLNELEIEKLKKDFEKPPTEHGFDKGYWTTALIKEHIKRVSGIEYSKSRICELMKEWDFSVKRPRMKSRKSDEKEQSEFIETVFPEKIKEVSEKAKKKDLKLLTLCTDEAGIRRDGTIHCGWYKKGIIPEIPESNGRFESIKLIGAVNAQEGIFHLKKTQGRITTEVYADFLIHLSQKYKDFMILIVQDNAPWHGKVKLPKLLEEANITNIETINLPKYSPDMNPCEKLWKWLREHVSHCRYYESLDELTKSTWRFYRRAYKQRITAIRRFKTEKDLFSYVKAYDKENEADGMVCAIA